MQKEKTDNKQIYYTISATKIAQCFVMISIRLLSDIPELL